jgi:hypothetical protein
MTTMRSRSLFGFVLGFGVFCVGCYDLSSDPLILRQEGTDHRITSSGGTGGTGGTDPGCVPSGTTEIVDDSCGVFVSASNGNDANGEGTKEKPFATLEKALTKGSTIYACADDKPFDEALALKGGVTLFGGLDCTSWSYTAGTKTSWTAPAGEVAATVKLDAMLHVEDFTIEAKDAPVLMPDEHATGRSSIAIVAEAKSALELNRCDVIAGNGGDGAAGKPPMDTGMPGVKGDNGADGCDQDTSELPGNGGVRMCDAADVGGGQGGLGNTNMSGGAGSPGQPFGDMGKGGVGQTASVCESGSEGAVGMSGPAGKGAASDGLGSLTATGFIGVSGDDGTPGTPGQGGGGGGGAKLCANGKAGPSGGGGGSGGCAGVGGKGGYGGGASIGIVSIGAKLSFAETKITTKNGGKGGAGADGQPGGGGGIGGMPGAGDMQGKACAGGKGGDGGAGGKGGGGRGGHSIAIAHRSAAPEITGATLKIGTAGDGGDGDGDVGKGAAGVAKEVQAF